jgi:hypothetical protein
VAAVLQLFANHRELENSIAGASVNLQAIKNKMSRSTSASKHTWKQGPAEDSETALTCTETEGPRDLLGVVQYLLENQQRAKEEEQTRWDQRVEPGEKRTTTRGTKAREEEEKRRADQK